MKSDSHTSNALETASPTASAETAASAAPDNAEADHPPAASSARGYVPSARVVLMMQALCVLLALLPIMAYNIWLEGQDVRRKQIEDLKHAVQSLAALQTTLTTSTESLLLAVSLSPAVQTKDAPAVYRFLERLDTHQPLYDGFAVFDASGDTLAGVYDGLPRMRPAENIRSREYFTQSLVREGFHVGRVLKLENGQSILPMTMTVVSKNGHTQSVVMAALSMSRLTEMFKLKSNADSAEIYFFDKSFEPVFGTGSENTRSDPGALNPNAGLMRSSAAARLQLADPREFLPTVPPAFVEGRTLATGVFHLDGPTGCFASAAVSLRLSDDAPYMYIVAIAREVSWASFVFQRYAAQLAATMVFILILLYFARFLGAHYFTGGLERLEEIAVISRSSNLSERCGPVSGCRELRTLGASFDHMLDNLEVKNRELYRLSHTDPLTGLWNRRHFTNTGHQQISLATRQKFSVAVIMADVDHFKRVNDTYGHAVGDLVLQQFAAALLATVRASDLLARYGGEEFILLLPVMESSGVVILMEKLRRITENLCVLTPAGVEIRFTASFGGALHQPRPGESAEDVLVQLQTRADSALYTSKNNGRNRSTLDEE